LEPFQAQCPACQVIVWVFAGGGGGTVSTRGGGGALGAMITVEFCAEADAANPIEAMAASDGSRKRVLYIQRMGTDADGAGWRPEESQSIDHAIQGIAGIRYWPVTAKPNRRSRHLRWRLLTIRTSPPVGRRTILRAPKRVFYHERF